MCRSEGRENGAICTSLFPRTSRVAVERLSSRVREWGDLGNKDGVLSLRKRRVLCWKRFEAMSSSDPTMDDWQVNRETLRDRCAFLFNNDLMSDIVFAVPDSEDNRNVVRVASHKFVLGISSPVFYAMFYGNLAETSREIKIPDTESKSLIEFLRFLYSDEVHLCPGNVLGVMYLAQKYMVPSLLKKCASFLEDQISEDSVLETLMEARKFHQQELEKRCLNIVDVCTERSLNSAGISLLDQETLADILKRDTLSASESSLFCAAVEWAQIKSRETESDHPSGPQLRERLGDALFHIRFPMMPQETFAKEVVHKGILTESEVINVFLHYSAVFPKSPKFSCLPRKRKTLERCCVHSDQPAPQKHPDTQQISAEYTSVTDGLAFSVDKAVLFKGVRLYAQECKNVQFKAELQLRCGRQKELGGIKGTYHTSSGGQNGWVGFDVELPKLVTLRPTNRYSITVVVANAGEANVMKNIAVVDHGQLSTSSTVSFNILSKSRNTQILELLFYTTWSLFAFRSDVVSHKVDFMNSHWYLLFWKICSTYNLILHVKSMPYLNNNHL